MQKIKVNIAELMQKLKINRHQHKEDYKKALEGFKEEAIESLQKALEDAKAGKDIKLIFSDLVQPSSHLADYDRAILMLEVSVDKEIELSNVEFGQFIMDEWHWKQNFLWLNMKYHK